MWIEETEANALWRGKASFYRISHIYNNELLQLAKLNFEFKQSIYRKELEELKGWSKVWGLSDMGFGREKTTYCYFAIAASTSLPCDSYVRMLVAKSALLITVADDFFDMKGSLNELEDLTDAVRRWDSRGLSSHSKIIFDALENLVTETATKYLKHDGTDITSSLQDLWYETFLSWLIEAKWSRMKIRPSIDDYIKTGMTSVATHTLVLPASCFVKPSLPIEKLRPKQYETVTKLLMVIARLLNDMQSYQKEKEEGKVNSVLAFMIENSEAEIEDSIAHVREILDKKKKELLEHVLMDGFTDLPKPCKDLHLSCLKVFQMFFNSTNRFDSNTEVLRDIKKAIYFPLEVRILKPLQNLPLHSAEPKKKSTTAKASFKGLFKQNIRTSFTAHQVSRPSFGKGYGIIPIARKLALGLL
ncbi:Terpene synthase [Quillaja saponaria]|uniref:Terpene synthase n=1 Tax=Quillaja saponaria TaxID=32244 RepID=A0AAD7PUL3_QUISA|nr:Terpene synthase [Quillaja saponaria]